MADKFLPASSLMARMWQQLLGHMTSLIQFVPRGRTRMCLLEIKYFLWNIFSLVFEIICQEDGQPLVELFAMRTNIKFPVCMSPISDSMVWKLSTFQHPWDN